MNPQHKAEDKAGVGHWDETWKHKPRMRLPRACSSSIRDKMTLLRGAVEPGMKYLEIGCAPGKMLAWVAAVLGADVSGLDYSEPGVRVARQLFRELNLPADLRQEDVFNTSFDDESFDVVYSGGVIEHFEDPRDIVRQHVRLLKPGGLALITVPNLGGLYGRIASRETLDIHNLNIMRPEALRALVPADLAGDVEAYRYGRFTLGMGAIGGPSRFSQLLRTTSDLAGMAQPFRIESLCPTLVLKIRRKK